jgi:hypothetical protein
MKEFNAQVVQSADNALEDNWRITATLENGGNTPTKNLLSSINCQAFDEAMPDDFAFPNPAHQEPAVGLIGLHSVSQTQHVDIPLPLMEHVAHGHQRVFLWGWVDYDDAVGGKSRHRTEFCFEVLKHGEFMSFRPHGKFNGADDDAFRLPAPYVP